MYVGLLSQRKRMSIFNHLTYFTDTLAKWFFDNFSMFADSFSVVSSGVARGGFEG